jgi:hypothetical protein
MNQLTTYSYTLKSQSKPFRFFLMLISFAHIGLAIFIDNLGVTLIYLCFSAFTLLMTFRATNLEINAENVSLRNAWSKKIYWSVPTNYVQSVTKECMNWAYYKQRFLVLKTKDSKIHRFRVIYKHLHELNSIFGQFDIPFIIDINNKRLSYESCLDQKLISKYD